MNIFALSLLYTGQPQTGTLSNSDDRDIMQHSGALYYGLFSLLIILKKS